MTTATERRQRLAKLRRHLVIKGDHVGLTLLWEAIGEADGGDHPMFSDGDLQ